MKAIEMKFMWRMKHIHTFSNFLMYLSTLQKNLTGRLK